MSLKPNLKLKLWHWWYFTLTGYDRWFIKFGLWVMLLVWALMLWSIVTHPKKWIIPELNNNQVKVSPK